eukprot:4304196-Amphidinium_carterae.1
MITRGPRPRGAYGSRQRALQQQRATTPIRRLPQLQDGEEDIKVEEVNDLTGQEYFVNDDEAETEQYAEEAANLEDIEM